MSYLELVKRAEERLARSSVTKDVAPGPTFSPRSAYTALQSARELSERSEETPRREPVLFPQAPVEDTVARLLGMPLDVFAQEGQPVEVRVPWAPVTLWFCPDTRHGEMLVTDGVSRGRIWTAAELIDLLSPRDLTPEAARVVALAKLEFDGDVVAVRPRHASTARPTRRGNGEGR